MEKATGGKVHVKVYAADQLTNGNQSEGIQALMNGDPVQISMHSNLIYSAFDPRFNVVSLPFIFNSVEDADAKLDGEAGEKMNALLEEYGLHCMGMAENGFRQLTNSVREVKTAEDMKNLKIRVAGSNLLMECYKRWGADATNMNWSETYTALQQNTVEGQENPLPAIDAASVQEVQKYCSMWNANYDCLFFCINEELYGSLTPEQQKVVDEAGKKAVDYERDINRSGDDEIKERWTKQNGVKITAYENLDIDSFKNAVADIPQWYQEELVKEGYDEAEVKELIEAFTSGTSGNYEVEDRSDLAWEEQTWNFACSTTETSTWAEAGRKFGEMMEKATGGKIHVNVYAADQLTNGNQSEGIQALMNGDPVQISMHSNLIYSAFDPRFNVVSLPFLFDSVKDADAKLDGAAGEKMKEILESYGVHCMGMAENGFRQLTNSVREVKSVDDMKSLKIRVAGSNLLMECYKRWGADATNMNWSETYTALQQNTVEGQENPLPAIDAASVQEVQKYCSLWNANYDCLFFGINQEVYDKLTPEQQEVVDEIGQKAVQYEREINRAGDDEILNRWQTENGMDVTAYEDLDIDSFKKAVEDIPQWYEEELVKEGYDKEEVRELIRAFTSAEGSTAEYSMEDSSDLDWNAQTWNFACSTTETSTWAKAGEKFGELMEQATGGKVKVNVYAADQLTNGNQSEGIQALMDGDPVQISMHSNLIYSAFDPRFNVVSIPYLFQSVEDADKKLDGEGGEKMKEILGEYGLHCMGMAENGFRELTNSVREIKSTDDMKGLKIRVAGSNLLMECYKRWGADATNMNWSETYTALQQNTVEGQENPLPAIDAASVQEVQKYCSMWNANYDCLFFCINQELYDSLTPEQQKVVDEAGAKAVKYEREINRAGDDEIKTRWANQNGVKIAEYKDLDIDSFKKQLTGLMTGLSKN
ncbi:DctP family TRAP transporter solute-binding subunit [Blautia sp. RD014234]|nr:DctP family TRAP transporter solute-binding subunit [Blautia parvula]